MAKKTITNTGENIVHLATPALEKGGTPGNGPSVGPKESIEVDEDVITQTKENAPWLFEESEDNKPAQLVVGDAAAKKAKKAQEDKEILG